MEEEANENSTSEVFRSADVLREIFKYLPTSTLISSCSLVNKLWREEARSFIRDKRECTVNLGISNSGRLNLWNQLCELDRVLRKMDTIPFNSLRVFITNSNAAFDEEADMNDVTNLVSRFSLKFLSVFENTGRAFCKFGTPPAASAILELVRENSSTLLELENRSSYYSGCVYGVFSGWEPPRFENLKKLSIANDSSLFNCAKEIIRGASNLGAIHNNCLHMIPDVISENMYGTLKRLVFGPYHVDHVEKFADKLGQLEELLVDFGGSHKIVVKNRCVALFHKLLASNNSTLCSVSVKRHEDEELAEFNPIHLPLLPSVKALSISVGSSEKLDNLLALDFRGSLPNLCNVRVGDIFNGNNNVNAVMVLQEDIIVAPNASETTMELTIYGRVVRTSDLAKLRSLFPNVIKLSFTRPYYFPPLDFAAVMWPHLQSLSVRGFGTYRNLGAQVLGLRPEEWTLVRQQDKEVLRQLQLVPSRPCVLTMRELKHFELEHLLQADNPDVEAYLRVLEPLVIGRMPGLSFKIKQVRTYRDMPRCTLRFSEKRDRD